MRTQCKKNTQPKETQEDGFYTNPKANKTIHHKITQPTSIREYGFYTNLNDATRPNIMNSLNQPQSESMDSTRILAFTKQKQRSNKNHNRCKITQPNTTSGVRMQHASQCNIKCKSGLIDIQIDHPSPRPTLCQENLRKQGGMQNEAKSPNFGNILNLKPIWPLGAKTQKFKNK